MRYKIGNATLLVECTGYDYGPDNDSVGGGNVTVGARDYLRVKKRQQFEAYGVDMADVQRTFDDDKDASISLTNDDFIVFLDAISREPRRTYRIDFDGLATWFWHDVVHAENHVSGGSVYVDASIEDWTLYEGAKLARAQGVKLSEIVQQLVKAQEEYAQRFKTETDSLDRFLFDLDKAQVA